MGMVQDTGKLLSLGTFVNLVGARMIGAEPPAWDVVNQGPVPDRRTRLTRFGAAYRQQMANPATASDFPVLNTREAWLQSFAAWEKIVMVSHAIERSDRTMAMIPGAIPVEDETDETLDPEYAVELLTRATRATRSPEPETDPLVQSDPMFAGGASGGAGGGATFTDLAGAQQAGIDAQIAEQAEQAEPPAESAPLESTTVDPVAEPITEPATFDTPSDQSDR